VVSVGDLTRSAASFAPDLLSRDGRPVLLRPRFERLYSQSEVSDHDRKFGRQLADDRKDDGGDRLDVVLGGFRVAVQRTMQTCLDVFDSHVSNSLQRRMGRGQQQT